MIKNSQPWLFGTVLTGCAVFIFEGRIILLTALMLFLPLLDRNGLLPEFIFTRIKLLLWGLCLLSASGIILFNPAMLGMALATLILTALPEEWFFRGYFMSRLEQSGFNSLYANLGTSILFALLHLPTQGLFGLGVFFPSLFFGWVYQRSRDLVLVILLHALSNIFFFAYIKNAIKLPAAFQ
ncbi:hypothetical protein MNBD_GAMMA25-2407 [hydrothermal vent metagenome]|uniref:CAAX prenyl protease 2/Lysostaphin resistance protein A-like domain-containing protein n=1 Tax=hydrothermal vent metagenome TaxID=652676 RepID=A0A3B1B644_9ZZZZ